MVSSQVLNVLRRHANSRTRDRRSHIRVAVKLQPRHHSGNDNEPSYRAVQTSFKKLR